MKILSISLVSAAILAAASAASAQTQQQNPGAAPGATQGAPAQQGGSGAQTTQPADPSAKPSNDARGGTQAQGAVPGTTDKSATPGGADKPAGRAETGDKPAGDKPAGRADTGDKPGQQGAGTADKPKDSMNKDAAQTPKAEGDRKQGDQAQGGANKPAGDSGKSIKAEQKTVIKQTIVQQNIKPAKIDVQVRVGVAVPRTVVLYAPPPTIIEVYPAYSAYKIVLVDNDTILIIDPTDWTIVDIIQV